MGLGWGGIRQVLGWGLLGVVLLPLVAIGPGMVVDQGRAGELRASAFPAALVVLDPLVGRCVRNSVLVAALVTLVSTLIGMGLGLILGRRRFWGRWLLGGLALVPLAVGPTGLAPGVIAWIGGDSGWEWLAARSMLGQPGDDWARWMALVWVGVVGATPLVILATRAGLDRVDPAWADAARVVGAGRGQVWRDVTWPTIRPGLAQVASSTFALTLVEPAGPMILGLRRTLAVALTDAAFRLPEPNRAATLALLAVGIAFAARAVLLRWGGSEVSSDRVTSVPLRVPRAGIRLGGITVLLLGFWALISLGPTITFARRLVAGAIEDRRVGFGGVEQGWFPPEVLTWGINSVVTAGLAVGLDLIVLLLIATGTRRIRWLAAVPPLALAAGAVGVPFLITLGAATTDGLGVTRSLGWLRVELSPGRSPGVLLVLVLAAVRLPMLVASLGGEASVGSSSARIDAALLVGATARGARRVARSRRGLVAPGLFLVAWAWAATDLASAWVLTPLIERQTLASAALHLAANGFVSSDPRLMILLAATTLIRLVALAAAISSRDRSTQPGDWLTGV